MDNKNKVKSENIKVLLPPIKGDGENYQIEGATSIVLIGANGVGKTRMSVWIENNNPDIKVIRVSAQKSLKFKDSASITDVEKARGEVLFGRKGEDKISSVNIYKWNQDPDVSPLDDVDAVMTFLVSDYAEKNGKLRKVVNECKVKTPNKIVGALPNDTTCMDIVAEIWNDIISHRKLDPCPGGFKVYENDEASECHSYNMDRLSDGEREIIYLIGVVLAAKPKSLIIIDEPESHLHRSVLCSLWDKIEEVRKDCVFLYVTHDYDFALSRKNSRLIWVHKIKVDSIDSNNTSNKTSKASWDYEEIAEDKKEELNPLMLEIYGSRKNVLLVEGGWSSIDRRLYSKVYPNYDVVPVGGCDYVKSSVIGYREKNTSYLHNLKVIGIIDRDRKSDNESDYLKRQGIHVLNVSQVEHLFMMPKVISVYCDIKKSENPDCAYDADTINGKAKESIFALMSRPEILDEIVLLWAKEDLVAQAAEIYMDERKYIGNEKLYDCVRGSYKMDCVDFGASKKKVKDEIEGFIKEKDFDKAIERYNKKELLDELGIPQIFHFSNRDAYIDDVISYIGDGSENGCRLQDAFKECIKLDDLINETPPVNNGSVATKNKR